LGYRPEELVGKHVAEYLDPGELEAAMAILTSAIADGIPRDDPYDVRFRHKNGDYRLLAVTGGMLGEMGLVVSSRDITEQRAAEREVVRLASYDDLTRLPNRSLSLRSLEDCVAAARSTGTGGSVLYLDIDRFKSVNDSLGHHCGDLLLQEASDRLRAIVPSGATLARHGGESSSSRFRATRPIQTMTPRHSRSESSAPFVCPLRSTFTNCTSRAASASAVTPKTVRTSRRCCVMPIPRCTKPKPPGAIRIGASCRR
jgi:hypothetical protein